MKVLVCGGRAYSNRNEMYEILDNFCSHAHLVIHGGARGADQLAGDWAKDRGICCKVYPADWKKYGKAAGALRNRLMLRDSDPNLVIAFPGGAGTTHMVHIADDAGYEVILMGNDTSILAAQQQSFFGGKAL